MNRVDYRFLARLVLSCVIGGFAPSRHGLLAAEDARLPVPPQEKVGESLALIRDAYEADYKSAKESEEPEQLIFQLITLAGQESDPVRKYALLVEAGNVAATYDYYERAIELLETRAERFQVDGLALKAELLQSFAGPKIPADLELCEQAMDAARQAMQSERFDLASKAATLALDIAKAIDREQKLAARKQRKKSGGNVVVPSPIGTEIVKKATALQSQVTASEELFKQYSDAAKNAKTLPDSPEANAVIGSYLCFVREDWSAGLPALAKGNLKDLSSLAIEEMKLLAESEPRDVRKTFEVAGKWWAAAESKDVSDQHESAVKDHAAGLYEGVTDRLTGALEKRLATSRLRGAKLSVVVPGKSDRPGKKLVDRLKSFGFEISELPGDVDQRAISEAPLVYIQGGSFHDQQGFDPGEVAAIKRYVTSGGSILCAGLAWPWVYEAYGNKPVATFPLNKIGKELGFEITGENINDPVFRNAGLFHGLSAKQLKTEGWAPSKLVSKAPGSEVVSEDSEGRPIVVAYSLGRGRVMVFGHPSMLDEDEEILRRSVRFLLPKSKIQPR
jgi:hypothetical protein